MKRLEQIVHDQEPSGPAQQLDVPAAEAPVIVPGSSGLRRPLMLAGLALFLWAAIAAASLFLVLRQRGPAPLNLLDWAALAAGASAPLALIGVGLLAWLRLGTLARAEMMLTASATAADAGARSRVELAEVEHLLQRVASGLGVESERLARERAAFIAAGEDLSSRASATIDALARQSAEIEARAVLLDGVAASARTELGVMLSDLPRAEAAARAMTTLLEAETRAAHQRVEEIGERLAALRSESEAAAAAADRAGDMLTGRIVALSTAADGVRNRLEEEAARLDDTLGGATARAEEALERTRSGLDAHADAMRAMIAEGERALEMAGNRTAEALAERLAGLDQASTVLEQQLAGQHDRLTTAADGVETRIATLSQQFDQLGSRGSAQADGLRQRLIAVGEAVDALTAPLLAGETAANTLASQAEALRNVLDEAATLLTDRLPQGLASADTAIGTSRGDLDDITARLEGLGRIQSALLTDASRLADLTRTSGSDIETAATAITDRLAAVEARLSELGGALTALDRDSETLTLSATGHLASLLMRVRDTAAQATENSREALDRVVDDTRQRLTGAAAEALDQVATGNPVQGHIEALGTAADKAVEAAARASERLARQMLTITETAAAVEAKIMETNQRSAAADQEAFAKRSALLIESLNSLSIDIGKAFAEEVPDTVWAAYLKGDRTAFTRRALRLAGTSDAKAILRHYEEEPEFRDSVNRYVHDFEAVIRRVMADREGGPMAVALLSSEIGKLYVTLAQAIERLRG